MYKPDGSFKKNRTAIIIMLALILIPVIIGTIVFIQEKDAENNNSVYGTWEYYGVIPSDSEPVKENIIKGREFYDLFGTNVPDKTITITDRGVEEYMNIKGTEIVKWEKRPNKQWFMGMEVRPIIGDGKVIDQPVDVENLYTLRDGYLFEHSHTISDYYDDSDYDQVYRR